ncbi:hypothetical protein EDD33_2725 [Nocardioides aurantiacus]|uniref:Acetyltransferase (GNAT) family protein n=2 Tax=Nocardioides aurantiacus TaxID=86796 RepID=A0A3N2CWR1_9ACTN|nr:hypothetical protein EDD33_2725 [Nocardioides aurantiacus]
MVATQMKSTNVGTPGLLGRSYLRRYYRTFIYNPACWTRVAYCDEHPAGFIVGVLRPAERSRTIPPRQRIVLLLLGLRALVIHPRLVRLLLAEATRRVPSNATGSFPLILARIRDPSRDGRSRYDAPPATLTYLTVRFIYEELGIGTRLVETFEAAALSHDVTTANVIVPPGDLPAEAFFRIRGWSPAPGSEPTGSDCARQLTRNLALTAPASGRSAPVWGRPT